MIIRAPDDRIILYCGGHGRLSEAHTKCRASVEGKDEQGHGRIRKWSPKDAIAYRVRDSIFNDCELPPNILALTSKHFCSIYYLFFFL